MERIFVTNDSWTGLILRVGLGIVIFIHGAQNLLGWFGGPGFDAAMASLTLQMHIPKMLAVLIIMAEFFGSIGLIIGAYARVAAFGTTCVMLGAIVLTNWAGKQGGVGLEFHLLAITIGIIIMISGAGRWSIDRAMESPRSRMMRQRSTEEECPVQPQSHL